jgi:glycosyltransferase involved in cell wall biosynthesis
MNDRRLRVVHVFKNYFPPTHGGIEHHIHDVAHGLRDRFDISVLCADAPGRPAADEDDGVRVIRAPATAWISTLPIVPSWPKLLRSLAPDLVHLHVPNPTGDALFAIAPLGVPGVATYHAEITRLRPLTIPYAALQRRLLGRMNRVITTSDALAATTPHLRTDPGRVSVIPLGIDPAEWGDSRPTTALGSRDPLVLFVGRLVHYKGVDVLIRAMQSVDARLFVVGDGSDRTALETLASSGGLSGRIRFTGVVDRDELVDLYHRADAVVLPSTSRAEGFGTVLLEAMACGTPVVSTELGTGTSWVNRDGETGFVVRAGDPAALARAIGDLLGSPELRARMGDAGRKRVRTTFTKASMLDALSDIYTSVAAGSR